MNEVFTNSVVVVLVEPNNQTNMARAIIHVLKGKNLAERLGMKGRELIVMKLPFSARKEELNKAIKVLEEGKSIGGTNALSLVLYLQYRILVLVAE